MGSVFLSVPLFTPHVAPSKWSPPMWKVAHYILAQQSCHQQAICVQYLSTSTPTWVSLIIGVGIIMQILALNLVFFMNRVPHGPCFHPKQKFVFWIKIYSNHPPSNHEHMHQFARSRLTKVAYIPTDKRPEQFLIMASWLQSKAFGLLFPSLSLDGPLYMYGTPHVALPMGNG